MDVKHDLDACDLDKYFQFPYSISYLKIQNIAINNTGRKRCTHPPNTLLHTLAIAIANHCHSHHIRSTVSTMPLFTFPLPTAVAIKINLFVPIVCLSTPPNIYSRVRVKHIGKLIHECDVITLISEHHSEARLQRCVRSLRFGNIFMTKAQSLWHLV